MVRARAQHYVLFDLHYFPAVPEATSSKKVAILCFVMTDMGWLRLLVSAAALCPLLLLRCCVQHIPIVWASSQRTISRSWGGTQRNACAMLQNMAYYTDKITSSIHDLPNMLG
jgi:D-alanyl-lipoteichoic acid acyltransferase DltB (MBOAT superfamily)